jgi:ATP-dependent DNA helicase RecG
VELERIDQRDYPPEALREALLNAIVHRDYSISGPTLISIFDDRIEIITIGGLVRGISYDDMMLGVSLLRNPHLANVFYRLRLIEAYGTGMLKINECYADYDAKPLIEVTDNAFKMTLPNLNFARELRPDTKPAKSGSPLTTREEKVISLFEDQETIARKDVQDTLGVSQATAILVLREMVERGILVKESGGKYLRYRLAKRSISW